MCFVWVSTQPWHSATPCSATRRHRLATRRPVVDRDDDVGRRGAVGGQPGIQLGLGRDLDRATDVDGAHSTTVADAACSLVGGRLTTPAGARSVGAPQEGRSHAAVRPSIEGGPAGGAPAVTGAAHPTIPTACARPTNALSAAVRGEGARPRTARIRVEDLLSAAAAACGEACIAAAGDFDLEHHTFTPGAAVLSDRVNAILVADAPDWGAAATSVFGIIRGGALAQGYAAEDFPPIDEPMRLFVAAVGGDGTATPVGVRAAERAGRPPAVRAAAAPGVRAAGRASGRSSPSTRCPPAEWPPTCAFALVIELARVRDAIDHGVAVRLVLETVNGMAKTAPMTERHMREASNGSGSAGAERRRAPAEPRWARPAPR